MEISDTGREKLATVRSDSGGWLCDEWHVAVDADRVGASLLANAVFQSTSQ
jgi:hypothetical protein